MTTHASSHSCSVVRSSLLMVLPIIFLSSSRILQAEGADIKDPCSFDYYCNFEHGFCRDRKECDCLDNYMYNAALKKCVTANCSADSDCKGKGWVCKERTCQCVKPYYLKDEQCTKNAGLDEQCTTDSQCKLFNSSRSLRCLSSRCSCEAGFRALSNKTDCVPLVGLGGNCSSSVECGLLNSSRTLQCLHGKCLCDYGFRPISNNTDCVPVVGLGEKCSVKEDCKPTVSGKVTECWENVCSCKPGYRMTPSRDCGQAVIGDKCSSHRECQFAKNSTLCQNKTCVCKPFFVASKIHNNMCLQTAELGAFCHESQQCISPNSACEKISCKCVKGYRQKDKQCVKGGASAARDKMWFSVVLCSIFSLWL